MQIDNVIAKGQLIPLVLTQDAVAASQSAAAMNIIETGATGGTLDAKEYKMPFDGEIVAVSVLSDSARTAGTLDVEPTVNGTVKTPKVTLDATNTTHHYGKVGRGAVPFVAGDRIGAKVTTAAGWAPVAADIVVIVWVLVTLEGI